MRRWLTLVLDASTGPATGHADNRIDLVAGQNVLSLAPHELLLIDPRQRRVDLNASARILIRRMTDRQNPLERLVRSPKPLTTPRTYLFLKNVSTQNLPKLPVPPYTIIFI